MITQKISKNKKRLIEKLLKNNISMLSFSSPATAKDQNIIIRKFLVPF